MVFHAMRRSGSNSMTVLVVRYGKNMDPSMLECLPASAISAKSWAAGALMTRSTLTVFPCTSVTLAASSEL